MTCPSRRTLLLGAVVLSVTASTTAPARAATVARSRTPPNTLRIVVADGPHAGSYELPPTGVVCRYSPEQQQLSVTYKDVEATAATALSEAAITVSHPDDDGPRWGYVRVAFGDAARRPTIYEVRVRKNQPSGLTMTRSGDSGSLGFSGRTAAGVALTLSARCESIEMR